MKCLNKLKNKSGYTLLELMIVLSIASIVLMPAYLAMFNGFSIFSSESNYQTVLSDVHIFYDEMNSRIRLGGFKSLSVTNDIKTIKDIDGLDKLKVKKNTTVLRITDTLYYVKDNTLYRYSNGVEDVISESVINLQVISNDNYIEVNTTINVEGRQETISTSVYTRY